MSELDPEEARRSLLGVLEAEGTKVEQIPWYRHADSISLRWDDGPGGVLVLTSRITGSSYMAQTPGSSTGVVRALASQAGEAEASLLRSPHYSG